MLVFPTSAPGPLPVADLPADKEKLATAHDIAEAIRAITAFAAE